jgi:hypothetical protein
MWNEMMGRFLQRSRGVDLPFDAHPLRWIGCLWLCS